MKNKVNKYKPKPKTTTKMQNTTMNKPVYLLSQTGEWTPSDAQTKEIPESIQETIEQGWYTEIIETSLTPEQFLNEVQNYIGTPDSFHDDGDFYDFIPDVIEMSLQFAAAHGINCFKDFFGTLRENETLNKLYRQDEEETLHGYLKYDQDIENIDLHKEYEEYLKISERAYKLF